MYAAYLLQQTTEIMADRPENVIRSRIQELESRIENAGESSLDRDINSDEHMRRVANLMNNWHIRPELLELSNIPDVDDIQHTPARYPTNFSQR